MTLYETGSDFTNSFRKLSELKTSGRENIDQDISSYLKIILLECSSLNEFKQNLKPKFPLEFVYLLIFFIFNKVNLFLFFLFRTLKKLEEIMNEQPEV